METDKLTAAILCSQSAVDCTPTESASASASNRTEQAASHCVTQNGTADTTSDKAGCAARMTAALCAFVIAAITSAISRGVCFGDVRAGADGHYNRSRHRYGESGERENDFAHIKFLSQHMTVT
jgi:hypothetical protein